MESIDQSITDDLCMVHERDLVNLQAERDRYREAIEEALEHAKYEDAQAAEIVLCNALDREVQS